jgi:hypothetical protein
MMSCLRTKCDNEKKLNERNAIEQIRKVCDDLAMQMIISATYRKLKCSDENSSCLDLTFINS